jgi:hypothetical protein
MRALGIVMNKEGFCDGTNLLECLGMQDLETLLIIGAIESFNKGVFIGSMGWTHVGLDAETEQKPDEWGRKVASGGSTGEARIAIKRQLLRAAVRS